MHIHSTSPYTHCVGEKPIDASASASAARALESIMGRARRRLEEPPPISWKPIGAEKKMKARGDGWGGGRSTRGRRPESDEEETEREKKKKKKKGRSVDYVCVCTI